MFIIYIYISYSTSLEAIMIHDGYGKGQLTVSLYTVLCSVTLKLLTLRICLL